ncbi:MAG: DUF6268 family outer membrane beta-barrel protein [Bacteroidota bacterium]
MKYSTLILAFVLVQSLSGQMAMLVGNPRDVEPLSVDYGVIPDLGGTEIERYQIGVMFGKKLGKGRLGIGVGYEYVDFTFDETTNLLDVSSYAQMHIIGTNVSYLRPLKNNWGLIVMGGASIMSNLEDGITGEDFVFNALVGANKRWGDPNKGSSLLFGLLYGTQFGEPTILPAVAFRQQLNERWSYSLGLPITGINFQFHPKHRLSALASPQGIFGNNSGEVAVDGNRVLKDTKLQFNGINTRLAYRYHFAKHLALLTEVGFVPGATLKILDNDNEEIYDFDPGGGAYFNLGLRFVLNPQNLKRKSQKPE